MIGAIKYRTPSGLLAQVRKIGTIVDLPEFDVEVINSDGEVVEYIPSVLGNTGLQMLVDKRRWVPER